MLTIKHIEHNGFESVTTAEEINFIPASLCHADDPKPRDEVIAFGVPRPTADGCNRYRNGTIYVMNAAGATVSKFNLGE